MPKKRTRRVRVVYAVDWLDACGDTAWTSEAEARNAEPALCTTVGVIISRTKKKLVIAGTVAHHGDDQVGDVNTIPGEWIKSVVKLGEILVEEAPAKAVKTKPRA